MAIFLLSLRETLEASLLIGIVLSTARESSTRRSMLPVWTGVLSGLFVCLLWTTGMFLLFPVKHAGLSPLMEAGISFAAAILLGWTALSALRSHDASASLTDTAISHVQNERAAALFLLCFFTVSRESIELAIFVRGATMAAQLRAADMLLGAAGFVVALCCASAIIRGIIAFPFRLFSAVMTIVVACFGATIVARGIGIVQYEIFDAPSRTEQSLSLPLRDEEDPPLGPAAMIGATAYAAAIILSGRKRH